MSRHLSICVTIALVGSAIASAQSQKRFKDQAESDLFAQVSKEMAAGDYAKAISGLDAWKEKYPDSELKDDRQLLLLQACYKVAAAIPQIAEPSPAQLALAGRAGRWLMSYDTKPDNVTGEAWAQARGQLRATAKTALVYAALIPGAQALKQNDCEAAETALANAVRDWPDSAQAAWYLGSARLCVYKTRKGDASSGIYEIARAAALDPAKGMVDPRWQRDTAEPYLEKVYNGYHGPDAAGLAQLKELAAQSPFPAADFKIKSVKEIAEEKQAEFEQSNPQLALWMKIKGALADANGEQYFASDLKESAVPRLKGVLVDARPRCRPKELLVAVPLPDAAQPLQPEIALKLDKPLAGAPALNAELEWQGVPTAFTQSPFMLTMDTEGAKVEGLKTSACAPAAARKRKK